MTAPEPTRERAIDVLAAADGCVRVVVHLSVVQDEPFEDVRESELIQAVRDLEGLEAEERGFQEVAVEVLPLAGGRAACVSYAKEVPGAAEAEAEVAWLRDSLALVLPFEEDPE